MEDMSNADARYAGSALVEQHGWMARVTKQMSSLPTPVGIVGTRAHGINHIVSQLSDIGDKLVWVEFDEHDRGDVASQGNKLSDAVARTISARIVGHGLPVEHCLRVVARVVATLQPVVFVFTNVQFAAETCLCLHHLNMPGVKVYAVADSLPDVERCSPASIMPSSDLLLTRPDLVSSSRFSTDITVGELEEIATDVGWRYLPFAIRCSALLKMPPVIVPEPAGASLEGSNGEAVDRGELVRAFVSRGLHAEGLELAIRSGVRLDESLVEAGARALTERGLSRRLFGLLDGLGIERRAESSVLMKWYFASATAENRHADVRAEVDQHLDARDAPELRALVAAAFPGPDLVRETAAALALAETPLTLRIHAFALSQTSPEQVGAELLAKAMRKAEALGYRDQVMACSTDLADFWIKRGSYREALEWSRWALDYHVKHGLKDDFRRLLALGLGAFTRMLTGDTVGLEDVIDELDLSATGVPTMEALVSTRADWHFLKGELVEACDLYKLNLDNAGLGQYHHAAVDLVHALANRGMVEQSRSVATRALAFARGTDTATEGIANLAAGLSLLSVDLDGATKHLYLAQESLQLGIEAHKLAQASIALSVALTRSGDVDAALAALLRGDVGIRELAPSGWKLLGGYYREVDSVRRLYAREAPTLELTFLGDCAVVHNGERLELGLRHCEILAVLAMNPNGLSAEELGERVYGDRFNLSSLKAAVSRLRKRIPITSKPYTISLPVRADFLSVEEHIASGQLREALALYRGPLLPNAIAPELIDAREHLEELVRRSVLASGDADSTLHLARVVGNDMELVESAISRLPKHDIRCSVALAMKRRIERAWLLD
jgi:tetratricopeptide (TPR) repeat protein